MNREYLKFKAAVLCDDIRTERNNKDILIGVYQDSVYAKEIPSRLKLSLYVACETNIFEGILEIEIWTEDLDGRNKKKAIAGKVEYQLSDTPVQEEIKPFTFTLVGFPISVENESVMTVKGRRAGGRYSVFDKRLVLNQSRQPKQISMLQGS